jgi:hypothetical protein
MTNRSPSGLTARPCARGSGILKSVKSFLGGCVLQQGANLACSGSGGARPGTDQVDRFVAVAGDRQRLARLVQYCARPPIAMERLEPLPDGRLLYRFRRPWNDGTTHVILEPLELMEKLVAIVPAPKSHLLRYAGLLAPAAKWRALIVPAGGGTAVGCPHADDPQPISEISRCATEPTSETATSPEPAATPSQDSRHGPNYTWAELMKRVWALDVLECPRCTGRMRLMAAIDHPEVTRRILDCVGLPSRAPPVAPASNRHTESDWS